MYNNLNAEMLRNGVTKQDIERSISCSPRTATNKLKGLTDFTLPEAFAIRNDYFPGMRLEYLFAQSGEKRGA